MALFYVLISFNLLILSARSSKSDNFGEYNEICKRSKCLWKCCPEGEYVFDIYYKQCRKPVGSLRMSLDFSIPLFNNDLTKSGRELKDVYTLVPGIMLNEQFNKTSYDYSNNMFHRHYLTENGILREEIPNKLTRWHELNSSRFCVDYQLYLNYTVQRASFWTILTPTEDFSTDSENSTLNISGLLISCFFLTLVLIVYSLLPDLRALSGMVLMSYVVSMIGTFLLLAVMLLTAPNTDNTCIGLAYSIYFFSLSSFCWMTVMSYDSWRINSSLLGRRAPSLRSTRSKFMTYSGCAWGVPACMTIFLIVLNHTDMKHLPWFVTPKIPNSGCFLTGEEKFLYLYIPVLILIVVNWAFFLRTSYHLCKQYKDTAMLDQNEGKKQEHRTQINRILIYLKLSVIMGLSWLFEVVSSLKPDFKLWYLTDFYNAFVGFCIFVIFVCNRRVYRKLWNRFKANECRRSNSIEVVNL